MHHPTPRFLQLALPLALVCAVAMCRNGNADDAGTTDVKAGNLTLHIPGDWTQEVPMSRLRLTQFRIKAAAGDKEDGELAVFNFGGGGDVQANVKRWIEQFKPEGRSVKILAGKAEQGPYVFVELAGTYLKPDGPPVLRKTVDVPGSRVLAVILAVPEKGNYFLKMTGLDKTVAGQAKGFRASFGGDAASEKELKLDE